MGDVTKIEWCTDFREKGNYQIVYATHWMPLPEPPSINAEDANG